ncbi:hypothetical protein Daus18300_013297 [Diaporthe australafricana]|uniref:Uncharacterized protein n=1 Tax=Diaporthe australafricana TaxID=127596 RepID=A0ABR3VZJ7_9PEZI
MAAATQQLLSPIHADVKGARHLTTILQQNGIPCALWAVNAAAHYGGGLVPLDIEVAINSADQQRVFELFTSYGLTLSTSEQQERQPGSLREWYETAPSSSKYRDRRRTRLVTPIYELPLSGDPLGDMLRPFIIIYSVETVGLPVIPLPASVAEDKSTATYVPLSILSATYPLRQDDLASPKESVDLLLRDCMVPSFQSLVRSELHVLLMHAEPSSPVWSQHRAQLSELIHSRSCPDGPDGMREVVADEKFNDFIEWFRASLKGEADYHGKLDGLRAAYRETYHSNIEVEPSDAQVETGQVDQHSASN